MFVIDGVKVGSIFYDVEEEPSADDNAAEPEPAKQQSKPAAGKGGTT